MPSINKQNNQYFIFKNKNQASISSINPTHIQKPKSHQSNHPNHNKKLKPNPKAQKPLIYKFSHGVPLD